MQYQVFALVTPQGSLTEPEAYWFPRVDVQGYTYPCVGLQTSTPAFYAGLGDLNSGPHAWTESALTAELLPCPAPGNLVDICKHTSWISNK